jgi:hypothetical protein
MTTWTKNELNKIRNAEELQIAIRLQNGTLRNKVTIWVVRVDNNIYIRSYNGHSGSWYKSALMRHEGVIWAGGVEKNVKLIEVSDPDLIDQVDAAYQSKYGRYPQFVAPMLTDDVRGTTLKLLPQDASN